MGDEKVVVAQALLDQTNRAATAAGNVGAIIRAARLALGLSQAGLAARLGYVSQATVSRIERASTRAAKDAASWLTWLASSTFRQEPWGSRHRDHRL